MTEHEPVLTDADERLMELLRAGKKDAEIAVRMGVPVGDVKDRIARLVYKLNVTSRAELAWWPPRSITGTGATNEADQGPAQSDWRRDWIPTLLVPLAIVGALVFFFASRPSTGNETASRRTETRKSEVATLDPEIVEWFLTDPTARILLGIEPELVATLEDEQPTRTWGGLPLEKLTTGSPMEFLDDQVLLVSAGDGGDIDRLLVSKGKVVVEPAFRLERVMTQAEVNAQQARVSNVVASADGRDVVVTVCLGCAGSTPGATATSLYRSRDLGKTWQQMGTFRNPGKTAVTFTSNGELVVLSENDAHESRYEVYPSGAAISRPTGPLRGAPVPLRDGGFGWLTPNGAVVRDSDGAVVFNGPSPLGATAYRVFAEDGGTFFVAAQAEYPVLGWYPPGAQARAFDGMSVEPVSLRGHLLYASVSRFMEVGPDLSFFTEMRPALIDLRAGRVHRFEGALFEGAYPEGARLLAVVQPVSPE